jgi:hypothetical protein
VKTGWSSTEGVNYGLFLKKVTRGAQHTLLCLGAGSVTRTHDEINLDQRILDPRRRRVDNNSDRSRV